MPRIRKKTSRRGTTNQREKIKHKVSETRKKRKKESKKDQQWKTNNPKDPGIPNNFPYKDQILAEVAEERRRASEEKQRRKEKKAARGQLTGDDDAEGSGSEAAFDGVRSLNAGTRETAGSQTKAPIAEAAGVEEDIPVLLNRDLPNLKAVLDLADVVIQVLDARDPLRCRSAHIEEASKEKKILLVLNRTDACPREAVSSWATTLRAQRPTVLFRSASAFLPSSLEPSGKGKGRECADDAWGCDSVLACLRRWAQEKEGEAPLVVAVVGVANVGKSSFVNSLLGKAALPTYKLSSSSPDGPTTTIYPQEVSLDVDGKQVRLIDTPGLAWQAVDESPGVRERSRARDILTRSRGRIERLKDPASVLAELVSRANKEDLMLFYNLPAFADGDANAFLSGVARSNGLIKKGGTLDLAGASRIVLRDWSTGKFPRYTVPLSTTPTSTSDPAFADAYTKDEELLSRLSTRKELRKGTGVVKLDAGEPEIRKVALDASWAGSADGGDESDNEDENEDEDELAGDVSIDLGEEESEDDEEGEGSDEGGDDEKEPSPPRGKRKRGVKAPAARPAKKVAFAPEPKSTKQARSAAGARPRAKAGGVASPTAASAKSKAKPTPPGKQVKETKSALKKTPASTPGKVANVSSKKASVAAAPATHGAGEAYDFKQLF